MRWMMAATLAVLTGLAQAGPLRCGVDLVQVGDSVLEVLEACGEPAARISGNSPYYADAMTVWVYENEHGGPDRKVVFSAGQVERIERID